MCRCSRPVLQQHGRADVRRPHLLNGGHTLCVESVSRHCSTPATPCAATRAQSSSPVATRHHRCRLTGLSLFTKPLVNRTRPSVNLTNGDHSLHQQQVSTFTFIVLSPLLHLESSQLAQCTVNLLHRICCRNPNRFDREQELTRRRQTNKPTRSRCNKSLQLKHEALQKGEEAQGLL
jgi:hypothetical protein